VVFSLPKTTQQRQTFEDDDEEEYESEELEEAQLYFSDYSGYSSEESLEFNPWIDEVSPTYMLEENDDTSAENESPAIYLAQAEVFTGDKPKSDLHLGPLEYHQQTQFQKLLKDYVDICAQSQTQIGRTNIIKHRIITQDAVPISQPPYRCNPKHKQFLQEEVIRMEQQGLIKKSASPWASPVVIVDKKGGDKRLCVDYRKLNAITKADVYPLPRIDDMLESFGNATWFSTLDLASGYWQVAMDTQDIEKTAFITPFGLYEFLVMLFGLAYAPGTFQRLMNRVLQDYLGKFVSVYLDDVIIYTKGPLETHLDHLRQVFETLRCANLKIKLKKCYFCFPNIHFLGHVVGREGIHPDPEKIEKIRNFPVPTNLTQLRSALGLFSYYRKFIKDFSKIAKPMLTLLKKETPFNWTEKQQRAFDYLKGRLIQAPILTYPDFEQPFIIYTDASGTGLGAVLAQIRDDEKEHVIAYASRSMNQAETNYPITDQECLAVVWAVKHFQHYLGLKPFTIVTDHSALKWLKTSKLPKGRRARWIMELQQYDFNIIHRPGKANSNADALSRMYDEGDEVAFSCFMMEADITIETSTKPWKKMRRTSSNGSFAIILSEDEEYDADKEMINSSKKNEWEILLERCDDLLEQLHYVLDQDEPEYTFTENTRETLPEEEGFSNYSEDFSAFQEEHIAWTLCGMSRQDLENMYAQNIQIKQVIANQPITRGGSRCDFSCDIENHHVHTYCKMCKKNLFYGITIHDCIIGFSRGKIRPDMNPEYLINTPWWKEPKQVEQENSVRYLRNFQRLYNNLPIQPVSLEPFIAELD
jgi:hypothetical protein